MHRSVALALFAVAALAACADELSAPERTLAPSLSIGAAETPGRYLVVFRSSRSVPSRFADDVAELGGRVEHVLGPVGAAVVSGLTPGAAQRLAKMAGVESVDLDQAIPLETTRRGLDPSRVDLVTMEPASPTAPQTAGLFAFQWNMRAVSAPTAWAAGRLGSSSVTVAILDSGIDEGNPAVPGQRNIDLEGLVDRARSRSFMPEEDSIVERLFPGAPLWTDLDGHGTNVASQVSSRAFNLAGVTSQTRLMAVKVCTVLPLTPTSDPGYCSTAAIFAGFFYAVDAGADVINMSLGGGLLKRNCPGCTSVFNRVIQYAHQRGVTVVVAAGNDGIDLDHAANFYNLYCDVPHVICVAATGAVSAGPASTGPFETPDAPAIYSNFGRSAIDVSAPGGNVKLGLIGEGDDAVIGVVDGAFVWSLCPRRTAAAFDTESGVVEAVGPCGLFGFIGTSQSSPHVAGLAAMLVAEHGRNPDLIRDLIAETADQLGASGNDPRFGRGRINVARAVGAL